MNKFSLFDFVAFVLPGGTLLIMLYMFVVFHQWTWVPDNMPGIKITIIPFLLIAYMAGHFLSIMGRKIENLIFRKKPFWLIYLNANSEALAEITKLGNDLFNINIIDSNGNISSAKSGELYDKIYDYVEVQGKDEKIKVLAAQYGFFRNTSALWFLGLVASLLMVIVSIFCTPACSLNITLLIALPFGMLMLLIASLYLLSERKMLTMLFVWRTFLAMNINDKK